MADEQQTVDLTGNLIATYLPLLLDWRNAFVVFVTIALTHYIKDFIVHQHDRRRHAIIRIFSFLVAGGLSMWVHPGQYEAALFFATCTPAIYKLALQPLYRKVLPAPIQKYAKVPKFDPGETTIFKRVD